MKGRIYISGAFRNVSRTRCGGGVGWIDNDPHFWTTPPTWGICRSDLRKLVRPGDYVFFVLPKNADAPQMIYAYLKVKRKVDHLAAYHRPELRRKRMRPSAPGRPNGNIIVDARGRYNPLDGNPDHRKRFRRIREHYVVGDARESEFLSRKRIERLAPRFADELRRVFRTNKRRVIDVISRWGRVMNEEQVDDLSSWLRG